MKSLFILIVLMVSAVSFGQIEIWPEDSLKDYESDPIPVYTKEYLRRYNRFKRIVVKVYPYALHAADIIDEIDKNAASIERRRKRNKFYKQSYKELKANFKYFILDLYTSEGAVLMKLIHRETGMTVYDISLKYRGRQKAEMFEIMAKIWDQDLKAEFNPSEGDDKVVEHVITDIQSGRVAFNDEIVTIDKLTYRERQKEHKEKLKANKKKNKEFRKQQKEKELEKRRNR